MKPTNVKLAMLAAVLMLVSGCKPNDTQPKVAQSEAAQDEAAQDETAQDETAQDETADTSDTAPHLDITTGEVANGEVTGNTLSIAVAGNGVKEVRFSCKAHLLGYYDEQQILPPPSGEAKQLTISYAERDPVDYSAIHIAWAPWDPTQFTTSHVIADLPPDEREDVIVAEFTLQNGDTLTKAINIKLSESELAVDVSDYNVTDKDVFISNPESYRVYRPDENNIELDDTIDLKNTPYTAGIVRSASVAASKYYAELFKTDMNIALLKLDPDRSSLSEGEAADYYDKDKIAFFAYVGDNRDNPRHIVLVNDNSSGITKWKVINEGY